MKIAEPEPGFYQTRLAKDGPWVPVRIWHAPTPDPDDPENPMDRSHVAHAQVGDQPHQSDPVEVERIWIWAAKHPVSPERYEYLVKLGRWSVAHAPDEPAANPREAVDVTKMKPAF
jgi:hypothetical protein